MYYIWSLITTLSLFAAIQYNEYIKDPIKYNIYNMTNVATIIVLYLMLTIAFYMLFEIDYKCVNKLHKGGCNHTVDQTVLRKINDPIYTGFHPYDASEL